MEKIEMEQIKIIIDELILLKNELNENNQKNKKLRKRIFDIENQITTSLQKTNMKGLKYKGETYIIIEEKKQTIKSKKDRIEEFKNICNKQEGITDNPEKIFEIFSTIPKDEKTINKLKVSKIKLN